MKPLRTGVLATILANALTWCGCAHSQQEVTSLLGSPLYTLDDADELPKLEAALAEARAALAPVRFAM